MMKKILFVFMINCFAFLNIHAKPGDIDYSFGFQKNGKVITSLNRATLVKDMKIDDHKNIIITGTTFAHTQGSFIARYTADGIPDSSFSKFGIEEQYIGRSSTWTSIGTLPNSDLIVGGFICEDQTRSALAKYSTQGILNTSFCNSSEPFKISIGEGSCINALAITSDNNIIAGGNHIQGQSHIVLFKYSSDGLIDRSFGNNGFLFTKIGMQSCLNKIIVQPCDNKIIGVGYVENGSSTQFVILRYNQDGTPDMSFGNNGIASTQIEHHAVACAAALTPEGSIIVAGFTCDLNTRVYKFAVTRYDSNGKLDPCFGNQGIVITPVGYNAEAKTVAIQSDGKIIVGGTSLGNRCWQYTLVRYNRDGSLDENFGNEGIVTTSPGKYNAQISSIAIQNETTLIAAGSADEDIVVIRYQL